MYKNQYFSFPTKPQSPSSKPLLQAVFPSPKQKNFRISLHPHSTSMQISSSLTVYLYLDSEVWLDKVTH